MCEKFDRGGVFERRLSLRPSPRFGLFFAITKMKYADELVNKVLTLPLARQ